MCISCFLGRRQGFWIHRGGAEASINFATSRVGISITKRRTRPYLKPEFNVLRPEWLLGPDQVQQFPSPNSIMWGHFHLTWKW